MTNNGNKINIHTLRHLE